MRVDSRLPLTSILSHKGRGGMSVCLCSQALDYVALGLRAPNSLASSIPTS